LPACRIAGALDEVGGRVKLDGRDGGTAIQAALHEQQRARDLRLEEAKRVLAERELEGGP
jgi:hypothetical protein